MTVLGTVDAPLDIFGGLVTDMAPADLPAGVSPDCADVAFISGAVQTRPGLAPVFAAISGNPAVNYLKTYIQPNLTQTLLTFDSAGTLWGELSPGSLSTNCRAAWCPARAPNPPRFSAANTSPFTTANSAWTSRGSTTAPISIASARSDRPPGRSPSPTPRPKLPKNISSAVRAANSVTITTSSVHNFLAGQTVTIAGVTDASFNGVFVIAATPTTTTLHLLAGRRQCHLQRRHGYADAANLRRRAQGLGLLQDAPGLPHASPRHRWPGPPQAAAASPSPGFPSAFAMSTSSRASWRSHRRAAIRFITPAG